MKNLFYILFLFTLSVSATEYYVTTGGSGTTCSAGSPCDIEYAIETKAVAGDTVWVKAGLYSDFKIIQTNNGTIGSPIYIIGYKTTTGDLDEDAQENYTLGTQTIKRLSSFSYGDSVDSSKMPLMREARTGSTGSGTSMVINGDYVHLYNMQFQYYSVNLSGRGDNCVFKNIITDECGDFASASYNGQSIDNKGNYNTWKNIYIQNSGAQGFTVKQSGGCTNNTFDAISVVCDNTSNPTDYYFLFAESHNNEATNIYVRRVGNLAHYGHGICYKTPSPCYNNNVTGFIADNTSLEIQFPGVHDNTVKNGYSIRQAISSSQASAGITISNGAYDCTIDNVYVKDGIIRFQDWNDGLGGDVADSGDGFVFNQVTVDGGQSAVAFFYWEEGYYDSSADNNTFYNCTFYNNDYQFEASRANSNTQFINCIFDSINDDTIVKSTSPGYAIDASYSSTNFNNNAFTTPTGTNITTDDPAFVDAANGDFTPQSSTILGQGIATPYLSGGNNIGAVQSGSVITVTSVETFPTFDKMEAAETRQLYEFITPSNSDDLTGLWSSSNDLVATVNSSTGLVTGVGTGTCNITFTTTDGSFTDITAITVEASSTEDSIAILNPQGYYDGTSGDADSWDDISGFELHGTEVGTITFTGNQATFDGSSYYDLPDREFLDYQPTTDEFTIVYREGDTAPTTQGYAIAKRGITERQYGIMAYDAGNLQFYWLGGGNENAASATLNDNRLVIVIVETNQVNVWVDGINVITNSTAIGSETYPSGSANIGGRTDGSYLMNNGATLDLVATIPKAISAGERAAIESEFRVNLDPVTDLSTRPAAANGTPVFYNNGRKILNPN